MFSFYFQLFFAGCFAFFLSSNGKKVSRKCSGSCFVLGASILLSVIAVVACTSSAILTGSHVKQISTYRQCVASTASETFKSPPAQWPQRKILKRTGSSTMEELQTSTTPHPAIEMTTRYPGQILCVCQAIDPNLGMISHHYYFGHNDCKAIFYGFKDHLILLCVFSSLGCLFSLWSLVLISRGDYISKQLNSKGAITVTFKQSNNNNNNNEIENHSTGTGCSSINYSVEAATCK